MSREIRIQRIYRSTVREYEVIRIGTARWKAIREAIKVATEVLISVSDVQITLYSSFGAQGKEKGLGRATKLLECAVSDLYHARIDLEWFQRRGSHNAK